MEFLHGDIVYSASKSTMILLIDAKSLPYENKGLGVTKNFLQRYRLTRLQVDVFLDASLVMARAAYLAVPQFLSTFLTVNCKEDKDWNSVSNRILILSPLSSLLIIQRGQGKEASS